MDFRRERRLTISLVCVLLVCSGCHNKIPQSGWLKQQKFIFSLFWRLEEQRQRLGSGEASLQKATFSLYLTWSFYCGQEEGECFGVTPSSPFQDNSSIEQNPNLWPHLTLMTFLKAQTPNMIMWGVQFSHSVVSNSLWPHGLQHASLPVHHQLLEFTQTHVHWVGDAIQPSHPLLSPSPPASNLSQHQGLFKWVSSSHQVAKVLEFQLQHQSFQWTFRTDFL